ncbi:MAG: glycosyltransferase family 39 protein [Janthinobacterium lividum]
MPLLLLLLLAAALRLLPLPHEALSGDEIFSHHIVTESLPVAWHDIREDLVHPPLYYLLLKASTTLWGAGAIGLRVFSILFGLLTLPLLVLVGSRLPGERWCGLLAAACVAVGRYDLFYSQEARSYAFYTALVLLLVLWLEAIVKAPQKGGLWIAGGLLMTALVYTHYVGGVYVALLVLAVLLSRERPREKLAVFGCGFAALLLFLPWLWTEASVFRSKHGLADNLDWQGHPTFYDVRQVWAISLGVGNFPGATMLALLFAFVLSAIALVLAARHGGLRRSPAILAIVLMGWLPPILMFGLSEPPINLSLFALRHVLPSTVLLLLLCCYGVERLAAAAGSHSRAVAITGAACLALLAGVPTLQLLHAGTSRYPYDRVEGSVIAAESHGAPAYAVWFYGEGEPVNFYCGHACVQPLPTTHNQLPSRFVLLYRPGSGRERKFYQQLLGEGFLDQGHEYFTDGQQTPYGTMVVTLERNAAR